MMIANLLLPIFLLILIRGTTAEIPCPITIAEILYLGAEIAPAPPTFFLLYTRNNPYFPQNLTFTSCTDNTYYNPKLKTIFIAFGYNGKPNDELVTFLKANFLLYEDCNVIIIDWSIAASAVFFPDAIRNTLITGKHVATELDSWKGNCPEINFGTFHIIGMSLGGQMVGFIGQYMKTGRIGRITGLDPAGTCFADFSTKYKLDSTDADFVDVISTTTSFTILLSQPTGHLHIYPDGGQIARGCGDLNFTTNIGTAYGCSHIRPIYLFAASLYSECLPVAYKCTDQESFNRGECYECGQDGKQCAAMGIHADKYADKSSTETTIMHIITNPDDDYFLYLYHVEITLASNGNGKTESGKLVLFINDDFRREVLNKEFFIQYTTENFQPALTYTYLMSIRCKVTTICQLKFLWYSTSPRIDSRLYVQCVKIVPMNDLKVNRTDSTIYGTTNGEAIPPEKVIQLNLGSSC